MSVHNFSRTLAREFGSTPAKFVARLRLETANRHRVRFVAQSVVVLPTYPYNASARRLVR